MNPVMTSDHSRGFPPDRVGLIIGRMRDSIETVSIRLWKADAIVLFDWLMSVGLDAVPITHPAEKQALTDLLTQLEQTEVASVRREEIKEARDRVSRDMDW